MRKRNAITRSSLPRLSLLSLALVGLVAPTQAADFTLGDFNLKADSRLTLGSSWRTNHRNSDYIANGTLHASGGKSGAYIMDHPLSGDPVYNPSYQGGSSSNTDNGNMNFDKWDAVSTAITGNHDFSLSHNDYQNLGVKVGFRYWYDFALANLDGAPSNSGMVNDYKNSKAFKDAKSDIELTDAYIWGEFDVADRPAQVLLGRHVLNWGESTFIQGGQNVANPVDATALRRPGAEVKDALLPVAMLSGSMALDEMGDFTLEAYYQLEWQRTRADACGTYFSNNDFAAEGCGPVYFSSAATEEGNNLSPVTVAERASDNEPKTGGQFGIALKWYAEQLNGTEFGLSFQNIHSRMPLVGGILPENTFGAPPTEFTEYRVEFPEDQKVIGLSFATSLPTGTAWSGEFTYRPDAPVQINANDVLARGLAANFGINSAAEAAQAIQAAGVAPADAAAQAAGQAGVAYLMLPADAQALGAGEQKGYREFDIFQFQTTFIHDFNRILGADNLRMIGELGFTYVDGLPDTSEMRFGRSSIYGSFGKHEPTLDPSQLATDLATSVLTNTPADIMSSIHSDNGYVTEFSWGYRLVGQLQYSNALIGGLTLTPTVSWTHDVSGYGPEPGSQFYEGRKILGTAIGAEYMSTYTAELSYTHYLNSGSDYWDLDDRDFISLSLGVNF